ncbi:hypothetical protein AXF42_Ash020998 [Apostasia shenzhenica]|uniref:Succinate dehydrogenase assembly factor 4, mitochondrial n=1 Tax=Apostasia shenzhenica TaxID=1088818 RepID=A0A2I0AEU2_9ASPA|nr:hypothetical protein AXF42_Ash020998 [Apostasia shenzhenica]
MARELILLRRSLLQTASSPKIRLWSAVSPLPRAFSSSPEQDSQGKPTERSSSLPVKPDGRKLNGNANQREDQVGTREYKEIKEIDGPEGPEPTRFGDWERRGRCCDFSFRKGGGLGVLYQNNALFFVLLLDTFGEKIGEFSTVQNLIKSYIPNGHFSFRCFLSKQAKK